MRYKSTPLSVRTGSSRADGVRRVPPSSSPLARLKDYVSTLVIIGLVPVLILPTFGAGAFSGPSLSVVSLAYPGETLAVIGSDFPRGSSVVLSWNDEIGTSRINVGGSMGFATTFTVPFGAAPGTHTLAAVYSPRGNGKSPTIVPLAVASVTVLDGARADAVPPVDPTASDPQPTASADPTPLPASHGPAPLEPEASALASRSASPTASPTPLPTPAPAVVATPIPTPIPTVPPSPVAAPVPAPPPPNTSGVGMPSGNLPGWTMIFADDFNTNVALGSFPTAVSSKWSAYPSPWRDTSRKGLYAPQKTVSISNSMMDIWLHMEDGVPMVAAPVPQLPGGNDQLYGRYAVRFRADPIDGYKTAWLLWPQSNTWPRDGEIDFPEGELDGTIHAFMHRQGASSGSDQDAFNTGVGFADWHTAVIEWTPSSVTFLLDGAVIGRSTSRIPNTPMHWVLQTETSLNSTMPSPAVQGHVQIDWVAVWRYTP